MFDFFFVIPLFSVEQLGSNKTKHPGAELRAQHLHSQVIQLRPML